ncbi:hypothetical protein AX16_006077 [Volvariella volvacea WC 439]|nr:hypothetical protein AX16_006077 [Volvariella volvacea WC 439]
MTLVCMTVHVPLRRNPNRPGFMALAQIPVVFLFSMKNSIVSLLLGPGYGYEKLNFIHRWSGRCLFFGSLLHGILWIVDHRGWGIPVLGQKKEITGIIALVFLFLLILTSLKPIRKLAYEVFFVTHVLGFIGFLAALCYHTIFASRWILLGVAFYGFDIAIRFLRLRVKDAYLTPAGNQMTIVRVPHCDGGWIAGQHVHLRVFSNGRTLESHPLTILSAPPHISCISSPGIYLAVRSAGGWSQALSKFTTSEHQKLVEYLQQHGDSVAEKDVEVPTRVMLDGPYGGCSIDLGEYESVLLLSGGSGATFTIGLLDDIVGRCAKLNRPNGERTRRIQFVWCIRSFGAIEWFAPILTQIAETAELSSSLDLCIIAYVTCMCNPDAIPQIPNQDVRLGRPSVHALLQDMITPPSVIKLNPIPNPSANSSTSALLQVLTRIEDDFETSSDAGTDDDVVVTSSRDMIDAEHGRANDKLRWVGLGGGLAVCVSGPESLTVEASNTAVKLSLARGVEIGGVGLHTEVFSI